MRGCLPDRVSSLQANVAHCLPSTVEFLAQNTLQISSTTQSGNEAYLAERHGYCRIGVHLD